ISIEGGDIRLRKPITYQQTGGGRAEVASRYELKGKGQVGFKVAAYDRSQPLVIDPILVYSTYLGGAGFDSADGGIVVDASGNAYVAGYTQSANFPTTAGVIQTAFNGSEDAFVVKLNPTGSSLIYATYLGGSSGAAVGFAIAVDSAGNVYLAGATNATNFPTTTGAFQTAYSRSS